MGPEKINEFNDKLESGKAAVKGAIIGLKNLMMSNADGEKIGKGMKSLVQKQAVSQKDRDAVQESLRTAFKFDKS